MIKDQRRLLNVSLLMFFKTEEPSLRCPSNITTATDFGAPTANVIWESVSTGQVSNEALTVTCSSKNGSDFALGTTYVVCSAFNSVGKSENCTFAINVIGKMSRDQNANVLSIINKLHVRSWNLCILSTPGV